MGCCEHGNEHSGSKECREFLEELTNCWHFKKDAAQWSYLVR